MRALATAAGLVPLPPGASNACGDSPGECAACAAGAPACSARTMATPRACPSTSTGSSSPASGSAGVHATAVACTRACSAATAAAGHSARHAGDVGVPAAAPRLAPADAPYRHGLVVRGLTALKTAGRLDEALQLADVEVAHWSRSPDFYFALGDLYLECASQDPDRAATDYLPIVESAWKRCLEIGEQPQLDGSVAGRGSHMAAYNLAVFYETLGQAERAREHHALAARLRR